MQLPRPIAFVSLVLALSASVAEAQWPQFRGPNGSGVAEGSGFPVEFSPSKNLAWKTAVPYGQSSPVVAGSRLYVTASEGEQLVTLALDPKTGRQLWRRDVRRARAHAIYKANDPASPTPAADDAGVVAFFPDLGIVTYAPDGAPGWTFPLGPFQNFYGMAASPIIADGLVIQLIDQQKGSYLLALDRATGAVRWRSDRPGATIGYATPMVFRPPAGRPQVVTIGSTRLDAYDLATGAELWWTPIGSEGSMGTAVARGETLFVSTSGSNEPSLPGIAATLARMDGDKDGRISAAEMAIADKELSPHFGWIDTSEDGFITPEEWEVARTLGQGAWGATALRPGTARGLLPAEAIAWRFQRNIPYVPTPLVYGDVYYLVKTGGIVTSVDPSTGALLKQGRATGALGEYYASPVAADGKVYIASREGKIAVLKAGPEWEVLSVNDLGEEVSATPALAQGTVFVRGRGAVYGFTARADGDR